MSSRKSVGKNIRQRRIELGWSQEELASRVRAASQRPIWSQAYISRVEAGLVNLTLDSLDRLSDATDLDASELLQKDPSSLGDRTNNKLRLSD